jgi:hypothetical protein
MFYLGHRIIYIFSIYLYILSCFSTLSTFPFASNTCFLAHCILCDINGSNTDGPCVVYIFISTQDFSLINPPIQIIFTDSVTLYILACLTTCILGFWETTLMVLCVYVCVFVCLLLFIYLLEVLGFELKDFFLCRSSYNLSHSTSPLVCLFLFLIFTLLRQWI